MAGGSNNDGVLLHQLGAEYGADCPFRLIEKRTSRQQEAQLHQRLMLWQQDNPAEELLPLTYGVLPAGGIWRLFLAYVSYPCVVPLEADSAGELLANLAFRFHCIMGEVHPQEPPEVRALLRRQYRRMAIALSDCDELNLVLIRDIVDRLALYLAPEKLVLAHNDLHWENVRVEDAADSPRHRLIDLGSVCWNLAGAEFHAQVRQSLMGGAGEPLWPHAISRYAELSGTAPSLLKLSALWYGLVRSAAVWKRVCPGASDRRRKREARLLTRLVSRLCHELSMSN